MRNGGKPFTDEELKFIRENSAGMFVDEIAAALNRPYASVIRRIHEEKLPMRRKISGPRGPQWRGCNKTCPDFCPYEDCMMPTYMAAENIEEDFKLKELFEWHDEKTP